MHLVFSSGARRWFLTSGAAHRGCVERSCVSAYALGRHRELPSLVPPGIRVGQGDAGVMRSWRRPGLGAAWRETNLPPAHDQFNGPVARGLAFAGKSSLWSAVRRRRWKGSRSKHSTRRGHAPVADGSCPALGLQR